MHVRSQIRRAAALALDADPQLKAEVYQSRVRNLDQAKLPAIFLYTVSETSEVIAMGGPMRRVVELQVVGAVKADDDLDRKVDDLADHVERVIAGGALDGLAKFVELTSTDVDLAGEGDNPIATITIIFEVEYRTARGVPGAAI
jgi:hypothetical protein